METLQNLLAIAIEVVAVAGFGGIVLHAIWSSHCKWMKEYCPPVEFFEPAIAEPVVTDPAASPADLGKLFYRKPTSNWNIPIRRELTLTEGRHARSDLLCSSGNVYKIV